MNELKEQLGRLITVFIPVMNEEKNLPECLDALRDFPNVVLIDSGSTDRTLDIAREYGREVLHFEWNGKFPKKRNWALRTYGVKTLWVQFIDADERMNDRFAREIAAVLPNAKHDVFLVHYDNWFMGRMLRHGDSMRKSAILRYGKGEYERVDDTATDLPMEIHEQIVTTGTIGTIKARLEHHDRRSLESYYAKHEEYANWEANRYKALEGDFSRLTRRQRVKYSLLKQRWFGFAYFCASYFLKLGFLDGYPGFVFARGKWKYFANIRRKILFPQAIDARKKI